MADLTTITNSPPPANAARLPALPAPELSVDYLARVKEIIEVLLGRRGSNWDRAVTFRDLQGGISATRASFDTRSGQFALVGPALTATELDTLLRDSRAYRELQEQIGSVASVDDYPEQIRQQLSTALASVAHTRRADLSNVENRVQTAEASFASRLEEVTAAVNRAAAGVREYNAAYADDLRAVATQVTQLAAQLEAGGGGVEIEERLTAISDAIEGLQGQWSLKLQTNPTAGQPPVIAGIALSVDDPIAGPGTSSLIFMAEKFGFLTGNGTMAPFTIDGNNIVMNANVRINGTLTFGNVGAAIDAAKAAADAAKAAADATKARTDSISANGVLDRSEKPGVLKDWLECDNDKAALLPQAASLGVSSTAYAAAHQALSDYLISIPNGWSNFATDSVIDRTVYNAKWNTYADEKLKLINAIAAKSATAPSVIIGGRNLFPDGDFERGIHQWTGGPGISYAGPNSVVGAVRGAKSFFLEGTGVDIYSYSSTHVAVTPGVEYRISYYAKSATSGVLYASSSYLRLWNGNAAVTHVQLPLQGLGDQNWRRHVVAFVCPAGVTHIEPRFGITTNGVYSWLAVDCVQIEEGTKETQWMPSPEDMLGAPPGTLVGNTPATTVEAGAAAGAAAIPKVNFTASISGTLSTTVAIGLVNYGTLTVATANAALPLKSISWTCESESDTGIATYTYSLNGDAASNSIGVRGSANNMILRGTVFVTVVDANNLTATASRFHQVKHGTYTPQ